MRRLACSAVILMAMSLMIARTASATTYYVAANGSDSNSGTSKTSPWLHAPGMPNCSATCSSATVGAGDSLIFRGGDAWHFANSSASPYVGSGGWTFSRSGTSSNCELDASAGTVVTTSCIYVGTDQSWYAGAAFARPILTADNPLSTSMPASCTYNSSGSTFIRFSGSYLIIDDFDVQGACIGSASGGSFVDPTGTMVEISNCYFHGWTLTTSGDDNFPMISVTQNRNYVRIDHNVFDGSDSSNGTTAGMDCGFGIYGVGQEIDHNVFRRMSNAIKGVTGVIKSIHDNLFEYLYNADGISGVHGNVMESNGESPGNVYFYNNVYRLSNEGVGIALEPHGNSAAYIFNNVVYHTANPSQCMDMALQDDGPVTFYFSNNTFDQSSGYRFWSRLRPFRWDWQRHLHGKHALYWVDGLLWRVPIRIGRDGFTDYG